MSSWFRTDSNLGSGCKLVIYPNHEFNNINIIPSDWKAACVVMRPLPKAQDKMRQESTMFQLRYGTSVTLAANDFLYKKEKKTLTESSLR
jgi:hypothetical protein